MIQEGTPGFLSDPKGMRTAKVEIIEDPANGFTCKINGQKVPGIIGYEIVHDRTRTQAPILKLHVQCSGLLLETGAIPEVPEPWSWLYDFTWKQSKDPRSIKPGGPLLPGSRQDN